LLKLRAQERPFVKEPPYTDEKDSSPRGGKKINITDRVGGSLRIMERKGGDGSSTRPGEKGE